jgi:RND family efflux transporter MFP subunit
MDATSTSRIYSTDQVTYGRVGGREQDAVSEARPDLAGLRIEKSVKRATGPGWWFWVSVVVMVVAGALAAWWFVAGPAAKPVRAAAVVERVTAAGGDAVLNASGYVTARRRATVSSKITGKVVDVRVEEGMAVREGQVLARLDDTIAQASLALAQAQLDAARRAVTENEVRLDEADRTLARRTQLLKEGVIGKAELDAAQAEVDSYKARIAAAREQVTVAERQVALRKTELDDTVVRAPFGGIAISKDAQPGEMVSPISAGGGFTRTGICTVVDMSSLEIEVDVNEAYINRVQPGQPVAATLDAYPDWRIPAKVIIPVPTADRQKATVLVRIAFDELDPRILPDMGVKVAFLKPGETAPANQAPRARLLIPRAAARAGQGGDVVFVIRDDRVERRAVRLGGADGDFVEVVTGLSAGEQIVVDGPPDLADGDRIVVRG